VDIQFKIKQDQDDKQDYEHYYCIGPRGLTGLTGSRGFAGLYRTKRIKKNVVIKEKRTTVNAGPVVNAGKYCTVPVHD
jgi:hypothetical protein